MSSVVIVRMYKTIKISEVWSLTSLSSHKMLTPKNLYRRKDPSFLLREFCARNHNCHPMLNVLRIDFKCWIMHMSISMHFTELYRLNANVSMRDDLVSTVYEPIYFNLSMLNVIHQYDLVKIDNWHSSDAGMKHKVDFSALTTAIKQQISNEKFWGLR